MQNICPNASLLPELSAEKRSAHLKELFQHLDPRFFGEDYSAALCVDDDAAAVRAVARYFRARPGRAFFSLPDLFPLHAERGERAIRGEVEEINVPWRFLNGRIDFLFNPTLRHGPVNHEWLWQLNRHVYWCDMAKLFVANGGEAYVKAFDTQLRDWIAQTDCPADWNAPGSAWRTIEAGLRLLRSWPRAFEVFRKEPGFSDENICLMLASMHRQACHLMAHQTGGNWLLMEMNGAYAFAALFPEFQDSARIREEAGAVFASAISQQVLPDGMQDELSPDYHIVAFSCVSRMVKLAQAEQFFDELPPELSVLPERLADAYLALTTPGFTQPRTNDCYTMHTGLVVADAAGYSPERADFRWVASNRREGHPPAGESASRFLPWAGFIAMRSDWEADAAYLCFDVGPLGMAHIHQDMLNINLYRGGEELIFDDGGGQYEESAARQYALSAAGHNTVLVDGLSQNRREPRRLEAPIDADWVSTPELDYARGVYDAEFGEARTRPAIHAREVRFCKPDFFCVLDTLTSRDGKPHEYRLLFHLDTLKMDPVSEFSGALLSDFGRTYDVLLLPLFPEKLTVGTVSGQTEPCLSGWFVGRNDTRLHPATTVSMTAKEVVDFRFATLLFPLRRGEALPEVVSLSGNRFAVTFRGRCSELNLEDLGK